jgi:hypothetical protein
MSPESSSSVSHTGMVLLTKLNLVLLTKRNLQVSPGSPSVPHARKVSPVAGGSGGGGVTL